MRKIIIIVAVLFSVLMLRAENYKPYIMGAVSELPLSETIDLLKSSLVENGLELVGEYTPADDGTRYVLVVTSPEIKSAIAKKGGLRGFAAAWRIGLTVENELVNVSYTNPWYFGYAYFQDEFDDVSYEIAGLREKLKKSMKVFSNNPNTEFGSKKGVKVKKLKKYHYKIAMPYFDDVVDFDEFENYEDAIAKIEEQFENVENMEKVYRIDIPDNKLTLYGFSFSGEDGESKFLPKIDTGDPKHTAFLPYEFLVYENKVLMLHGRFRIALSFPDLGMGTFMKIMSTPGNIADAVESLVK
jgi:uncharacterized protein (DUF302 family)